MRMSFVSPEVSLMESSGRVFVTVTSADRDSPSAIPSLGITWQRHTSPLDVLEYGTLLDVSPTCRTSSLYHWYLNTTTSSSSGSMLAPGWQTRLSKVLGAAGVILTESGTPGGSFTGSTMTVTSAFTKSASESVTVRTMSSSPFLSSIGRIVRNLLLDIEA